MPKWQAPTPLPVVFASLHFCILSLLFFTTYALDIDFSPRLGQKWLISNYETISASTSVVSDLLFVWRVNKYCQMHWPIPSVRSGPVCLVMKLSVLLVIRGQIQIKVLYAMCVCVCCLLVTDPPSTRGAPSKASFSSFECATTLVSRPDTIPLRTSLSWV